MGIHKITGQFYIGYRANKFKQKVPSHLDLGTYYFTSSKRVKEAGFENFYWYILAEFFDDETGGIDAYDFEQNLIWENWKNPLRLNGKHQKSGKFCTAGTKTSEVVKQKMRGPRPHTSEIMSKVVSGKGNPMYGKKQTPETCEKIRQKAIGRKDSEETRMIKSKASKGKSKSDTHAKNISKGQMGKLHPQKKVICPYCNKEGGQNGMTRFHFDKCPQK
jgi:hypothetical protein